MTRNFREPQLLDTLRGHIECQQPTANLYQFVGTLTVYQSDSPGNISATTTSLGSDNLLLRGARLKDTEFIYGTINQFAILIEISVNYVALTGCAVYTGQQTKLGLNSLMTSNKFSTVEK